MDWTHAKYDLSSNGSDSIHAQMSQILNDHYSDYNPLCVHPFIVYDSQDDACLVVYFPLTEKNIPIETIDGSGSGGRNLAILNPSAIHYQDILGKSDFEDYDYSDSYLLIMPCYFQTNIDKGSGPRGHIQQLRYDYDD